jgi:hypothetical protein
MCDHADQSGRVAHDGDTYGMLPLDYDNTWVVVKRDFPLLFMQAYHLPRNHYPPNGLVNLM